MRKILSALVLLAAAGPAMAGQYAFGDSVTRGVGAVPMSQSYISLLAAGEGVAITNYGQDGGMFVDMAAKVYVTQTGQGDISTISLGINDERIFGADPTRMELYRSGVQAMAAWLASGTRQAGATCSCSAYGSWTATPVYPIGKRSTEVGASLMFTGVQGTSVYVGMTIENGNTAAFDIFIDDVKVKSASPGVSGLTNYTGNPMPGPRLYRFAGLSNAAHTVKIVVTTAGAGVEVDWVGGNAQTIRPSVFVLNIPLANNYYGGSAANVASYNGSLNSLVSELSSDGLNVRLVDIYSLLVPAIDITAGDLHPNNSGHAKMATAVQAAIASFRQLPAGLSLQPTQVWLGSDGQFYAGSGPERLSLLISQVTTLPPPEPLPSSPPSGGGTCADVSSQGTTIGNMTNQAGMASVFTNSAAAPYTASAGGPINAPGVVGKSFATPLVPCKAVVWGGDGTGTIRWSTGSNSDTVTLSLMGKNGTCDGTAGTKLDEKQIANGGSPEAVTLTSAATTAFSCVWVVIASSSYGGGYEIVSSLRLFGLQ